MSIPVNNLNSTKNIPHLAGPSNYQYWAIRVRSQLALTTINNSEVSAWGMTGGTPPPLTTDADEINRRNVLNTQAIAIINATLPDSMILHGQTQARILWTNLETTHGTPGPAAVYAAFVSAVNWQLPADSDPAPKISQLETIFTSLASSTAAVPDVLKAMILLKSIPEGFEPVAQSILANRTAITDLTWARVRDAIQAAWSQRAPSSANRAYRGNFQNRWNNQRNKGNTPQHNQQQPQQSGGKKKKYNNRNRQNGKGKGQAQAAIGYPAYDASAAIGYASLADRISPPITTPILRW